MTRVEVEASPLGIKCVYHGGHVPNRGSHVLLVVVVTRLHAILFAEADEATKLAGSLLEFSPHVDHLILVIARLEEWYRMFGGDRQDSARRRVVRRSDLCGDHRDVQSLFADGGHGFGEVFGSTLRRNVPALAYRQVNSAKSYTFGGLSQSQPIHSWQGLREEAKGSGIASARGRQEASNIFWGSTQAARGQTPRKARPQNSMGLISFRLTKNGNAAFLPL